MSYTAYHSNIAIGAYCGTLSPEIARRIPRSTLWEMRRRDPSRLFGMECEDLGERVLLVRELVQTKRALKVAGAYLRLAHLVRSLGVRFHRIAKIKNLELRRRIVETVERVADVVPLGKVLRIIGMTATRFGRWKRKAAVCVAVPRSLCRKVYPKQLTAKEVLAIKRGFADPRLTHWPAVSIAWSLVKDGKVVANLRTIMRYAKLLGLTNRPRMKKCRKRGSITATRPNEVWHLDATVLRTEDNQKVFIQLLQDNYSRKILAWIIARTVNGLSTSALLRRGYEQMREVCPEPVRLIVDGGPENNNQEVEALLEELPVKKLVAGVQINCSNSMIEAVNKALKYQYLFRQPAANPEQLQRKFPEMVEDFNSRPHSVLSGLSPDDAYLGKTFDKAEYRQRILEAGFARRAVNRHSCPPCGPRELNAGENSEETVEVRN